MRILLIVSFIIVTLSSTAYAQTILLIHGYNSDAGSWRKVGISQLLHKNGWYDAGVLSMGQTGVFYYGLMPKSPKRTYTVNLPSEAPIELQATILSYYVQFAKKQHPKSPIILIGHSAGGIAARYMMVQWPKLNIDTLITISSPHLGSYKAKLGSMISNSPLALFAPFMGASTINRSQILYHQLSPEHPRNLLGWLNRRPHPKAHYISLIHSMSPNPAIGDSVIEGWRQDMNFVPALRGTAKSYIIPSDHTLTFKDAVALIQILPR